MTDTRDLDALEHAAITIVREAYATLRPLAMLWSMGKDSTALLWLVRKAFFDEIPFPLVQLDTALEFDEVSVNLTLEHAVDANRELVRA